MLQAWPLSRRLSSSCVRMRRTAGPPHVRIVGSYVVVVVVVVAGVRACVCVVVVCVCVEGGCGLGAVGRTFADMSLAPIVEQPAFKLII